MTNFKLHHNTLFMENPTFKHTLKVLPSDMDTLGHVNNVVYVRWVQEVAAAHWQSMPQAERAKNLVWVVLRHEIDYHAPTLLGDPIEGSTRVGDYHGARFERYVYIRHAQSGKLLAEAKTVWCLLDGNSMRPIRVSESLAAHLKQGNEG
jgi:acyl-CoA thioester hydrolase